MKVYSKYVTTMDSPPNSEDGMREIFTEVLLLEWSTEQVNVFQGEKNIHDSVTRILQCSILFRNVQSNDDAICKN